MSKPTSPDDKSPRGEGALRGRFAGRLIFIVPIAVVILLALLGAMYYTPLRIWYREDRQLRVLTEQKLAIDEYNAELRASLKSLETTEGIRIYAQEELGLVEEGETAVIVTKNGKPLTDPHDTTQIDILNIPLEMQPYGAWTPFLDALFQVELPK